MHVELGQDEATHVPPLDEPLLDEPPSESEPMGPASSPVGLASSAAGSGSFSGGLESSPPLLWLPPLLALPKVPDPPSPSGSSPGPAVAQATSIAPFTNATSSPAAPCAWSSRGRALA
jgi:hypothetical protein